MSKEQVDALLNKAQAAFEPAHYNAMLMRVGGVVGTAGEIVARAVPASPNGRPLALFYTLDGKPSKFKTEKQKKYFFWALKTGVIKVPYVRSGKLTNSITHSVKLVDDGAEIRVGTNDNNNGKGKAKYVLGEPGEQSHYHEETGWMNLASELEKHDSEFMTLAVDELTKSVDGFTT
jgi:hypothetical protein